MDMLAVSQTYLDQENDANAKANDNGNKQLF